MSLNPLSSLPNNPSDCADAKMTGGERGEEAEEKPTI